MSIMHKLDMKNVIIVIILIQGCASNLYLNGSELSKSHVNKSKLIHNLPIYQRISVWEWFAKPFVGSSAEVRSKALNRTPRELYTGA